ncbi:hypothetical protein [Paenibacillus sp. PAMC21692]|uniref:hypothetical protein n=1 Tax=Paenibacillus sp. PAMC21692 TaxID=2762320 RepID=UPI00164E509C|nr:hypothetical protein [Paenibacillus sp. PAMC21692]QNK56289.1 hypothetical protein H7F31_27665 [Paenibacillus sp. PAMC21692]
MAADDQYLYFVTNGYASGLPYNEKINCHFAVWSPEGRIVYKHSFPQGIKLGVVLAVGARVLVPASHDIYVFDTTSMTFVNRIGIGQPIGALVMLEGDRAAVFGSEQLMILNVRTGLTERICPLPGLAEAAVLTNTGELYFAWKSILFKLDKRLIKI